MVLVDIGIGDGAHHEMGSEVGHAGGGPLLLLYHSLLHLRELSPRCDFWIWQIRLLCQRTPDKKCALFLYAGQHHHLRQLSPGEALDSGVGRTDVFCFGNVSFLNLFLFYCPNWFPLFGFHSAQYPSGTTVTFSCFKMIIDQSSWWSVPTSLDVLLSDENNIFTRPLFNFLTVRKWQNIDFYHHSPLTHHT